MPAFVAKPKFANEGEAVYEVVEGESVTMQCAVSDETKPNVLWFRGDSPLYLTPEMSISRDGMVRSQRILIFKFSENYHYVFINQN